MWFVYIVRCADGHPYIGCTSDIDDRLKRNNAGHVLATKARLPVSLVMHLAFSDKYKAFAFEKYLKTGSGRAFMSKRFL